MTDNTNGEPAEVPSGDSSPNMVHSSQHELTRTYSTPTPTVKMFRHSASAANLVQEENGSASRGSSDNDFAGSAGPPPVPSQPPPVVKRRAPPAVRRFAANNRHSTPVLPDYMRQSSPNLSREPKTPTSATSSEVELERGFKYSNL
jgi:hypothetical protein